MGTRTFNALVVVFWLAATSWLVVAKIAPRLREGTPPQYLFQKEDPRRLAEIVCWTIDQVGAQPEAEAAAGRIGWAAGRVVPKAGGGAELQSRVFVWRVPTPSGPVMRTMLGWAKFDDRMELGINSRILLDEQSQLSRFESSVIIGEGAPWCTISGVNQGGQLEVTAQLNQGEPQPVASYWLGDEAVISDGNAPRGYLPGLKLGQSWKTHQLSPLKGCGGGPVSTEDLEATVKRREDILWDGHQQAAARVEFHRDSGAGSKWAEIPLRQMWVRVSDGMVLRDEVTILGFKLKFLRAAPDKIEGLAALLEKNWTARIDEESLRRESGRRHD